MTNDEAVQAAAIAIRKSGPLLSTDPDAIDDVIRAVLLALLPHLNVDDDDPDNDLIDFDYLQMDVANAL